jgi:hypothetical protein
MAGEKRLVDGDIFQTNGTFARLKVDNPIN